jgi:hypothetical protein
MLGTMDHVRHAAAGDLRSLLRSLSGPATAGLLVLGVGGTVYALVAPGGLLAQLFARSVAGGMAALLALFFIGLSGWMLRVWIAPRQRARIAGIFAYGFALAGLLIVAQFVMKGA